MKKLFIMAVLTATTLFTNTYAQNGARSNVLPSYLAIKDALISGNGTLASEKANDFAKAIASIEMNSLSSSEMNVFMSLKDNLVTDAQLIAKNTNLSDQRKSFATLSINAFKLAKAVKLTDKPLYYDFCPMKKSYWLSSEPSIKNPYFGNTMIGCGKVTETLK